MELEERLVLENVEIVNRLSVTMSSVMGAGPCTLMVQSIIDQSVTGQLTLTALLRVQFQHPQLRTLSYHGIDCSKDD